VQVESGAFPPEILQVLGGRPKLVRANNQLQAQFDYGYAIVPENRTSAFLCAFRQSVAMLGMVSHDWNLPSWFDEDLEHGKFKSHPFDHDDA
jgi:hypothetical protein